MSPRLPPFVSRDSNRSDHEAWQGLAHAVVQQAQASLPNTAGAALAFHSVADGIVHLDTRRVRRILEAAGALTGPPVRPEPPEELGSLQDLAEALAFSLQRGQALQRMISDPGLHRWLVEEVGYDQLRLGGTSANMAVTLAQLGVSPTIVYAYPPSRRVVELFPDLPGLLVFAGGPRNPLLPVADWAGRLPYDESPEAPLHWILEYGPELEVPLGSETVRPSRANRFIAGWNPANRRLRLEPAFVEGVEREAARLGFFFLSGYHILTERDGVRGGYAEAIESTAALAERVRRVNPNITVHLELASIGSAAVRREVIRQVLPRVQSLGLNEAELKVLAADLRVPWVPRASGGDRLVALVRAALSVSRSVGLARLHVHDLGNYAVVLDGSRGEAEVIAAQGGLLFAGAVAAARARAGDLSSRSGEDGLAEPFSADGLQRLQNLDTALVEEDADRRSLGVWWIGERWVVAVPTRVVERPRRTVGLGDTISASALLAETALRR